MRATPYSQTLLLNEQVQMLFNAVPNSVVANAAGALLAVIMYQGSVQPERLYGWVIMMMAVTITRYLHYRQFKATNPAPDVIVEWFHQFRIGVHHAILAIGDRIGIDGEKARIEPAREPRRRYSPRDEMHAR